jgi:hypothetical protein
MCFIVLVILCVVYCFECFVLFCVFYVTVVPLPSGTDPLAVVNNNNNNNNNNNKHHHYRPNGTIYRSMNVKQQFFWIKKKRTFKYIFLLIFWNYFKSIDFICVLFLF